MTGSWLVPPRGRGGEKDDELFGCSIREGVLAGFGLHTQSFSGEGMQMFHYMRHGPYQNVAGSSQILSESSSWRSEGILAEDKTCCSPVPRNGVVSVRAKGTVERRPQKGALEKPMV